ncbi:octopamine receptor Oamb-like [Schistocerca piceifrons]|uniref:octopamine receptor Oamb-like n=1 Tax=Schistocerca piceifrons TaxID=274613 RepID=UPI001F5E43FF|nr:octopamine receptor Oamb-like [Schistocerca piceifrons]
MDSVSGAAESGNGSLETQWCPEEPEIAWTEGRNVATLGVLAIIDVMVVAGNCLVVAAVFLSHKLRSVTNLFIVSLAVADLLVGVAVLPFSAAWEVFKPVPGYPESNVIRNGATENRVTGAEYRQDAQQLPALAE